MVRLSFGDTRQVLVSSLLTEAYDFPIHLINNPEYSQSIVMPLLATPA